MTERLPFHLLISIFFFARDGNEVPEFDHGGAMVRWDSTESAQTFCLVSRSWLDAGVFTLYRSLSIIGGDKADLFLRTIRDRPERADLVRSLVLGVPKDDEHAPDAERQSWKCIDVLEACRLVQHLQIRPLHPVVRPRLLAAIRARRLRSLVCLPRNSDEEASLYHDFDLLELVTPVLQSLEVDFYSNSLPLPSRLPSFPTPLSLRDFRAFASGSNALVLDLIKASGSTLENVSVYFETFFENPRTVAEAFAPSTNTLKTLSFLCNPTVAELDGLYDQDALQLFDRILLSFRRLESLVTAATEVSSHVFGGLPPSLRHLEVRSLNHRAAFRFNPDIVVALSDFSRPFGLEVLKLKELEWEESEVARMRVALEGRGTEFVYEEED
ncbi:hypothetical protein RQP46_002295 [Phenoliferia psychrophenolica]